MTFDSMQFPVEVQALLKTAMRQETSCGTGSMVWHGWGQASCNPAHAPVVLLHGGSGSWTHWLRNIAVLVGSGRWVLAPDLPGFGDSASPLTGNDADVLPELVEQGMQHLLGREACDLVGFSFGGMVAGLLAEQFPGRVARLVLVGAPGLGIDPEKAIRLNAWRHLAEPERDEVHRSNLATMMFFRPDSTTETALRLHMANVLRDRMQGRKLSRTDLLARSLAQVLCPVYGIYGLEDALFRGRIQALEPALRHAPDFRTLTLIEAAGHWVQYEQADAFNEALQAALRAAPGSVVGANSQPAQALS